MAAEPKPCSNCGKPSTRLRRGRCPACNDYLRRTGVERPVDPETGHARSHTRKGDRPCSNCRKPSNPLLQGRCAACHRYIQRTGTERPVDPATGEPLVRRFVGRG